MKSIIQSLIYNAKERVKNPFIGAFIISWTIVNWRTILFIIISNQSIENKILHIESNYLSVWLILLWPAIFALFYTLLLPYMNLGIDKLVGYSIRQRNEELVRKEIHQLKSRTALALEEIRFEEAKTDFRERKNHNQLVENLQTEIVKKDRLIMNERERNEKILTDTTTQMQNMQRQFEEMSITNKMQLESLQEENSLLKNAISERDERLRELRNKNEDYGRNYNNLQEAKSHLEQELNDLKREIALSYDNLNRMESYDINNRPNNRLER